MRAGKERGRLDSTCRRVVVARVRSPAHPAPPAAHAVAGEGADDDVEDGDDAVDDGHDDGADAVHDGHQDRADGAEHRLDLLYRHVSGLYTARRWRPPEQWDTYAGYDGAHCDGWGVFCFSWVWVGSCVVWEELVVLTWSD